MRKFILSVAILLGIFSWSIAQSGVGGGGQSNVSGGGGGGNAPGGGTATSGVFNVLNYGWVDDDSTDNCGAPVTNFLAAVNGYSGPGLAQAWIPEGPQGKAYKLATCNLIFTAPRTLYLWGTIDCAQSAAFANCIQEGPSNLANFTNVQTPPYTIDGTGVLTGCVNVTIACIEAEPFVSNPRIKNIHLANVGAGNASPPACTNYAISFDGHNNAPQVIGTEYWDTDGTTGRCWSINNRIAATGGTNSAYIALNTVISAGAAPGFTTPCGSVGHSESGSATMIVDNQFYGFGQPILLVNPQFGVMIRGNQIDQAGCTTNVASADIQYGTSANLAVGQITITNNYFAAHAVEAVSVANGSTSALSNFIFTGNITSGAANKSIFPTQLPPTCTGDCIISNNVNFLTSSSVGNWFYGVTVEGIAGQVTQAADVGAQTLVSSVQASAMYRVSCELKITQAATTSSTLPACFIGYTDADTSTVITKMITPNWAATTPSCSGGTTNTVGNSCGGQAAITAKGGTAISYSTSGYASVGGTPMQFTIRGRAEKIN